MTPVAQPVAGPHLLVLAKAPEPGRVKTRLAADIGAVAAAELAAASLLDTLETCTRAVGPARCHLALAGDLDRAVDRRSIRDALDGWTVHQQHGDGLDVRIAHAHAEVPGPVLQIGMDTPQLTAAHLDSAATALASHDAALGPAEDGGWWILALREPGAARALVGVPMSTPSTYALTRAALSDAGLGVATLVRLRDVDTVADARAVSAVARGTRFAAAWGAVA